MTDAGTRASSTLSERLDRLPFTRTHLRVLTGSGLGWALDAMDVGLISFVIASLAAQWNLEPSETAWIASIGFVGMAIGASVGGLLADRFGRRQVFAVTLLVYGLATGASALVGGLAALLVLRFLVGLGLGAELPVASTYVSEFAPARMRGRLIVILEAFWAVGWTAAALIGYLVIPGLRERLAVGVRARRDPRRLRARRAVGAARVRALARAPRPAAPRPTPSCAAFEESAGATAPAMTPRARRRAAGCGILGPRAPRGALVGGVPRAHRVPLAGVVLRQLLVLRRVHLDPVDPRGAGVRPGPLVRLHPDHHARPAAGLRGRRVAHRGVGAPADPLGVPRRLRGRRRSSSARRRASRRVIAAGMALSFFNLGAWGALYAVTPEMYPTSLRATGSGWAAGVGRIASIVAPLTVPLLLAARRRAAAVRRVRGVLRRRRGGAAWGLVDRRGGARRLD